jgi:hypothetical protein
MGKFINDISYLRTVLRRRKVNWKIRKRYEYGTGYGPKAEIWTTNTITDRQETLGNTTTSTILSMSTISVKLK